MEATPLRVSHQWQGLLLNTMKKLMVGEPLLHSRNFDECLKLQDFT